MVLQAGLSWDAGTHSWRAVGVSGPWGCLSLGFNRFFTSCWALTEHTHACSRTHLAVPFVLGPQNTPIDVNLVRFTPARLSSDGSDPVMMPSPCLARDSAGPTGAPGSVPGLPLHLPHVPAFGAVREQEEAAACRLQHMLAKAFPPNAAHERNKEKEREMRRAANSWTQPLALGLCFSLSLVLT